MLTIENGSRVFQEQVLQGAIPKQLVFSAVISSLGLLFFTPMQAFSAGCGFTATLLAYHEYRDYCRLRTEPISPPPGKFNLATFDKINHVEPWERTLHFCQSAMNVCGGIYLLTQVLIAPGVILTAAAGGSVLRLVQTSHKQTLLHHEWVAIGIAGLAADYLNQTTNPIGLYFLSAAIGYFGACFLIRMTPSN